MAADTFTFEFTYPDWFMERCSKACRRFQIACHLPRSKKQQRLRKRRKHGIEKLINDFDLSVSHRASSNQHPASSI